MNIRVRFFAYFREIFDAREIVLELPEGADVRRLLEALANDPRRRGELFEGDALKPLVIVMKNGTSVQALEGLETRLGDGDTVAVFPFIAGG
jgi:MoaD family protein